MKKRYVASPALLILIGLVWNIAWRAETPRVSAEVIQSYVAPASDDPRHPIEVLHMGINAGETEEDVVSKLPTVIYPEDRVRFVVDPAWGLGTIVHVERALPVTIQDGKRVLTVRTWANTVGELLEDIHRPLVDLDRANYRTGDRLTTAMTIEITRVSKVRVTKKEEIAFETEEKEDPNEYRGVTKVVQEGKKGEREKVYEITREDGEEVSRVLVANTVTIPPQTKKIAKGSKLKIGKTIRGKATWYDICCKKVAMNAPGFRKGTVVQVTNTATNKKIMVTVDDTGAFGSDIVIDLHPDYFKQLGASLGQGIMGGVIVEEVLNP